MPCENCAKLEEKLACAEAKLKAADEVFAQLSIEYDRKLEEAERAAVIAKAVDGYLLFCIS